MKKRFILGLIGVILSTATLFAQNKTRVTGSVMDDQQKPLDYATINLLKAKDSSLVKTVLSDVSGNYVFENIASDDYLVVATVVGYRKSFSEKFTIDDTNTTIALAPFKLSMDSKALNEVTVTVKKPFVERKIDRLVVNVETSSVSAGSTALEVLQKAPGIAVDKDDNISMQGKQGVLVMLDGKQTYMSNADMANMLRNMQSNEIETIELITNPSAKYDAAGNSGIINIKTKKNKNFGTNGTLVAGAGYGKNHKANTGITLNHRQNKINLFGNYNFSNNKNENHMIINRVNNGSELTYFGQNADMNRNYSNNNFKAGVDYYINNNNTLGLLVNGYINYGQETDYDNTSIGRQMNTTDSYIIANNLFKNRYSNMAYNLNYKTALDTSGQELSVDLDYSKYSGKDNVSYENYYYNNEGTYSEEPGFLKNLAPTIIHIKAYKADYTYPINKTTKLEAGAKSSWVKTDNDTKFEQLRDNKWENDISRSNQFIYDENVNAAYLNASKQFKKTSLQIGLRAEQTSSKGHSVTTENVVKRTYFDFFPSVFINHELSDRHSVGLSYSRRIDRPQYDALNDFVFFLNKYAYSQGNPYLKPQYTNSYELTYSYKKTYNLSVSYSLTTDVITEVLIPNTKKQALYQTRENLDKQIYYGMNLNIPVSITPWWNSNNNINGFYLGFRSADLKGVALNNGKVVVQMNTNHNFTINKTLSAELSANYQSPLYYAAFKVEQQYNVDAGISQSFAHKKVNLKLSVSDIFNTRRNRVSSAYPGLTYALNQKPESRVARLTLTYRFGNSNVKSTPQRKTSLEAETGRMKN